MKWVVLGLTVAGGFGLGWLARTLWTRRRERSIEGDVEDSLLAEEPLTQPEQRPIVTP
jgi:hypothetical protein